MTLDLLNNSGHEARLNEVLLACMEAFEAGESLDESQVLAAHPDLADQLRAFFASHHQVERITAPLRRASQEAGNDCAADIRQVGDFRLLREIGRGGMGVVYEAEQISLRRPVALKVLPFAAAIDTRQLHRFQNEALAAAQLHHENIVPVYAVGSERGVHYYAMQLVEGESLAGMIAELRRNRSDGKAQTPKVTCGKASSAIEPVSALRHSTSGAFSSLGLRHSSFVRAVADLGLQAARALGHAHARGVVHRDIKPANLLLDVCGRLLITDFGLAQCSSNTGLTATGELVGTLRYASPEQVLAKRGLMDHRTDIYSLGATLYELLTLRPIFDGRDRHELLRQIADIEPRPPRALDRTIPAELETIILKAVAKDPSERYATAQELADDLERFREDWPIRARRPSLLEKATKWARRHKGTVASALIILLVLVVGMSVTTLLVARAYQREREARVRAEKSFRRAREAVDQFALISEDELAGNPLLEGARRRLLGAALEYYKQFIEQRREDPSTREDLEVSRARAEKLLAELTILIRIDQYALLRQKAIQELLQLSEKQRQAVAEIDGLWQKAVNEFLGSSADWDRRRRQLAREEQSQVERVLDLRQSQRFKQIVLQSLGLAAFREPEVIMALALTAAQSTRIREIEANTVRTWALHILCDPSSPASTESFPENQLESASRRPERPRSANAETRVSPLAQVRQEVLTPKQAQRWKELTGEPVDEAIFASVRKLFTEKIK